MSTANEDSVNLFETGLYTIADVARLTRVNATRIRRWVQGYVYDSAGGKRARNPVWQPETPRFNGIITLGFNDLLEVRWVNEFRNVGVPLPKIREAVIELRNIYGVHYPFSREGIFTDGRAVFITLKDEYEKPLFYELSGSKHYAFWEITIPNLRKGTVYQDGRARKWHPNEKEYARIVIDPTVAFGRPVVEGTRIDTEVLASAYTAEQSYDKVADWYGIDPESVRQAVSFHKQLKAA